jgi:bacillithiol biosynthesis deacetylase BshB1
MNRETQLDILIFGAHPDDAEIGMGGTIVKHVRAGYKVGICDLTRAEMSSNGTVEQRRQEAAEASRILGLTHRSNLDLPDRGLFVCQEQIQAVVREIRLRKPRLIFAPFWRDRHPDHVACSRIVTEAVFNAKLRKYLPESDPVQVENLYYYYINDVYEPDLLIDISDVHETKLAALKAYRSQFMIHSAGESVQTILNQGYLEMVEARDRMAGQQRFLRYAEGFAAKLPYLIHLF